MLGRWIAGAERAAASLLAVVTVLTFASVALRYLFRWSIPDAYDLGRNLLGILIFWGIAVGGWRGSHITVDLVWGTMSARWRRLVDLFATSLATLCMAVFTWMMGGKVLATRASAETTYDLHIPVWPFQLVAWAGLVAAVLLLLIRLARQFASPPASGGPGAASH